MTEEVIQGPLADALANAVITLEKFDEDGKLIETVIIQNGQILETIKGE